MAFARSLVMDRRNLVRKYGIHLLKKLILLRIWQDIPWTREFDGYVRTKTPPGNVSIVFEIARGKLIGSSKQQWNYAIRTGSHTAPLAHIRILRSANWQKKLNVNNAPWQKPYAILLRRSAAPLSMGKSWIVFSPPWDVSCRMMLPRLCLLMATLLMWSARTVTTNAASILKLWELNFR